MIFFFKFMHMGMNTNGKHCPPPPLLIELMGPFFLILLLARPQVQDSEALTELYYI